MRAIEQVTKVLQVILLWHRLITKFGIVSTLRLRYRRYHRKGEQCH